MRAASAAMDSPSAWVSSARDTGPGIGTRFAGASARDAALMAHPSSAVFAFGGWRRRGERAADHCRRRIAMRSSASGLGGAIGAQALRRPEHSAGPVQKVVKNNRAADAQFCQRNPYPNSRLRRGALGRFMRLMSRCPKQLQLTGDHSSPRKARCWREAKRASIWARDLWWAAFICSTVWVRAEYRSRASDGGRLKRNDLSSIGEMCGIVVSVGRQ